MVTPSSQIKLLKKYFSDFENCQDMTAERIEESLVLASSLQRFIQSQSLFSKNELLEDLPTESISFFLVPYYKACILLKSTSQENRKSNLDMAESLIDQFLDYLDNYRLTPENFVERRKNPEPKSREEKIAAYKAKKELQNAISALENSSPEDCRDLYVKELELAAIQCLEHLDFIKLEIQMIGMKDLPRPEPAPYRPPTVLKIDESNIHLAPRIISSVDDLTRARANMTEAVFTDRNPYSMTIEEYGDWALLEMKEREKITKQAEDQKVEFNSDDEEHEEAKRKKDSEWNNWTDEHEKGAGNRNGR